MNERAPYFNISIHAPLAGSDHDKRVNTILPYDFNPRSPCGERQRIIGGSAAEVSISIHAPLAGSDRAILNIDSMIIISIHAPLAGSDTSAHATR